ncbi:hypothetical protein BOTCAL_0337g00140 [Botryotinia calthae]|uniref:Ketoreductase (KR) domain-containing protein n=1 Tax=Botryotinia calthae TaxID=38488 RepID=A0A4Y8CTV7_9HELO|nr:hypothetical protein BOTCAL_0337g00140 [Botryotinia calthae]
MVAINAVRASNAALKATGAPGVVAVFAGATSGIGMGTLKAFIKYANAPKAYIIGRSESAAGRLLKYLKLSNPSATLNFLEGEISLIKEVDRLCDEIKRKEEKVDIVFLSAGYLSFDGRNESSEGIDIPQSLRYYSRLRFAYNLVPLLKTAPNPRVISILAGGQEKSIDLDDLEVKQDFTMLKAAGSGTTQTTLAFEELARSNSRITFIHKYPGFIDTGAVGRLMSSTTGVYSIPATFFRWVMLPFFNLFATSVEEAGERGLFLATSARYPPTETREGANPGVELPAGIEIARSSMVDGNGSSNGVYRLKADDESAPDGDVLPGYRKNNAGRVVWESTMRVWERALEKA